MTQEERRRTAADGHTAARSIDAALDEAMAGLIADALAARWDDVLASQQRLGMLRRAQQAIVNATMSIEYGVPER
jgi:hypothetical protein